MSFFFFNEKAGTPGTYDAAVPTLDAPELKSELLEKEQPDILDNWEQYANTATFRRGKMPSECYLVLPRSVVDGTVNTETRPGQPSNAKPGITRNTYNHRIDFIASGTSDTIKSFGWVFDRADAIDSNSNPLDPDVAMLVRFVDRRKLFAKSFINMAYNCIEWSIAEPIISTLPNVDDVRTAHKYYWPTMAINTDHAPPSPQTAGKLPTLALLDLRRPWTWETMLRDIWSWLPGGEIPNPNPGFRKIPSPPPAISLAGPFPKGFTYPNHSPNEVPGQLPPSGTDPELEEPQEYIFFGVPAWDAFVEVCHDIEHEILPNSQYINGVLTFDGTFRVTRVDLLDSATTYLNDPQSSINERTRFITNNTYRLLEVSFPTADQVLLPEKFDVQFNERVLGSRRAFPINYSPGDFEFIGSAGVPTHLEHFDGAHILPDANTGAYADTYFDDDYSGTKFANSYRYHVVTKDIITSLGLGASTFIPGLPSSEAVNDQATALMRITPDATETINCARSTASFPGLHSLTYREYPPGGSNNAGDLSNALIMTDALALKFQQPLKNDYLQSAANRVVLREIIRRVGVLKGEYTYSGYMGLLPTAEFTEVTYCATGHVSGAAPGPITHVVASVPGTFEPVLSRPPKRELPSSRWTLISVSDTLKDAFGIGDHIEYTLGVADRQTQGDSPSQVNHNLQAEITLRGSRFLYSPGTYQAGFLGSLPYFNATGKALPSGIYRADFYWPIQQWIICPPSVPGTYQNQLAVVIDNNVDPATTTGTVDNHDFQLQPKPGRCLLLNGSSAPFPIIPPDPNNPNETWDSIIVHFGNVSPNNLSKGDILHVWNFDGSPVIKGGNCIGEPEGGASGGGDIFIPKPPANPTEPQIPTQLINNTIIWTAAEKPRLIIGFCQATTSQAAATFTVQNPLALGSGTYGLNGLIPATLTVTNTYLTAHVVNQIVIAAWDAAGSVWREIGGYFDYQMRGIVTGADIAKATGGTGSPSRTPGVGQVRLYLPPNAVGGGAWSPGPIVAAENWTEGPIPVNSPVGLRILVNRALEVVYAGCKTVPTS